MMAPGELPRTPPERRAVAKRHGKHRWSYFSDRGRCFGTLCWSADSRTGSWTASRRDPLGIFAGKAKHAMQMGFDCAEHELRP